MTFEEWQEKHGPNGGAYDIEMQRTGWNGRNSEVENLRADNAAMRLDAERYRLIRSRTTAGNGYPQQEFRFPHIPKLKNADLMRGSVAEHLDAAIDAARTVSSEPVQNESS